MLSDNAREVIEMANTNLLLNGITDLLILHLLKQKDCYGYEIAQTISELSDGLLNISLNTIYTAIYKMEKENFRHICRQHDCKRRTIYRTETSILHYQ